MGWRPVVGKLLLVVAGGGGLVLLVFVLLPWLTQMLEPEESLAPEEIVAEAMQAAEEVEERIREVTEATGQAVDHAAAHSPSLVAVRDNGEEIAVVFPAAGAEETQHGMPEGHDAPGEEEREEAQGGPAENLPPVLSPEEVAAVMDALAAGEPVTVAEAMLDAVDEAEAEGALVAETFEASPGSGAEPTGLTQPEEWRPEVLLVTDLDGGRHVEVTLPPPSATRDVQKLLESLGYEPGPLDGIWGERTDGAWRSFAGDAAERAARTELAGLQPERTTEPSSHEWPTPSGAPMGAEGDGERQAGDTRPRTGLPLRYVQGPVTVPGTLRGVMGYRMPLVSRQEVPDQIVSGVLIPAHTTFVILKEGSWELVDVTAEELEVLKGSAIERNAPAAEFEPARKGWNPLRIFRKRGPVGE
ncbi:MAG: hypothetical protein OXP66_05365 [Candidatus Tectomicrobia bacterium]|nr:hypothetical protein [Candidatus Tectomicrobia bacterium]